MTPRRDAVTHRTSALSFYRCLRLFKTFFMFKERIDVREYSTFIHVKYGIILKIIAVKKIVQKYSAAFNITFIKLRKQTLKINLQPSSTALDRMHKMKFSGASALRHFGGAVRLDSWNCFRNGILWL